MRNSDVVARLNGRAHLSEHARDETEAFAREEGVADCCGEEGGGRRGFLDGLGEGSEEVRGRVGSDGAGENGVLAFSVARRVREGKRESSPSVDVAVRVGETGRTIEVLAGGGRRPGVKVLGAVFLSFE